MDLGGVAVLLANGEQGMTLQNIGGLAAVAVLGTTILLALVMLLVRGFWEKTGKPLMKAMLVEYLKDQKYLEEQVVAQEKVIKTWHNDPEQIASRTKFIKDVIDNEVRRDDGVIHKDITTKINALEQNLNNKLDTLLRKIDELTKDQDQREKEKRELNTTMIQKLARIEGQMMALTGKKMVTLPGPPAELRHAADEEG